MPWPVDGRSERMSLFFTALERMRRDYDAHMDCPLFAKIYADPPAPGRVVTAPVNYVIEMQLNDPKAEPHADGSQGPSNYFFLRNELPKSDKKWWNPEFIRIQPEIGFAEVSLGEVEGWVQANANAMCLDSLDRAMIACEEVKWFCKSCGKGTWVTELRVRSDWIPAPQ